LYAVGTALIAALMIALSLQRSWYSNLKDLMAGTTLFAGAIVVGGSTVWFGSESLLNLAVAAAGVALLAAMRLGAKRLRRADPQ